MLLFNFNTFAQEKDFSWTLEMELHLLRLKWSGAFKYSSPEDRPKSQNDVLTSLKNLSQYKNLEDDKLLLKYRDELNKLFQGLGLIGDELSMFLCNNDLPIDFRRFKQKVCLLITDVASAYSYNTVRTSPKSRAAKVLNSHVLGTLNDFYKSFKDTDIAYYGIIISYGSKSFIDDSFISDLEPEVLCLIVSKDDCRKFVKGKMCEADFLNKSNIFIVDRNKVFKKVRITPP